MPTMQSRSSAHLDYRVQRSPRVHGADGGKQTELHIELPCNEDAPAAARDGLRRLDGIGWVLGDAMLVASELVSNAVRHSGAGEHDLLSVAAEISGGCLRITVVDPGRSGGTAQARSDADSIGGFGLLVVAELTTRWGAERVGGYRVWAEFELDGRVPPRSTL